MRTLLLALFAALPFIGLAQSPALVNYQGAMRDAAGNVMANQNVALRFTIHMDSANGPAEWQETQSTTTSSLGLVNVQLGSVNPLNEINWAAGNKFLQVELINGSNFTDLGTQAMLSVPYALYAAESGNSSGISNISLEGNSLLFTLSNGEVINAGEISLLVGCTDSSACNYSPSANINNGNCVYPGVSCNDENPATDNDIYNEDCICAGVVATNGCTNSAACNYSPAAISDDGSCFFFGGSCDDGDPTTTGDYINAACNCVGTSMNGTGNASLLLPGNFICMNQNISVSGCEGLTSINYNGHNYPLVEIAGQCWFAENLVTQQFNDGTEILLTDQYYEWASNLDVPRCAYPGLSEDYSIFGLLYSGEVASQSDICPTGWHVPSDCEWMYLENSIGMTIQAQQLTEWRGPSNANAIRYPGLWSGGWDTTPYNTTGFSAVPAGGIGTEGYPGGINSTTTFWSNTPLGQGLLYIRHINSDVYYHLNYYRSAWSKDNGYSIRCVRD